MMSTENDPLVDIHMKEAPGKRSGITVSFPAVAHMGYNSPWYNSIRVYAPLLTFSSLFLGAVYFRNENLWNFSTSFFYSVTALFGVLYYVPTNATDCGNLVTILYYIFGAFFLAGVLGTYGGWLVANAPEIAAKERRRILADEPEDFDGDGVVGWRDRIEYWTSYFLHKIGWEDHSLQYITLLAVVLWLSLGTLYGVYYEHWTVIVAVNFAVGTLSAAGLVNPPCVGGTDVTCQIGLFREAFLSLYILVGVPLFTACLGQFADLMVKRSIAQHEIDVLKYPLTPEEFEYASALVDDSSPDTLSLGEFTILELLRLGRITTSDLDQIKELYQLIDVDNTGQVDKTMLVKSNLMRKYNSFQDAAVRDRLYGSNIGSVDEPSHHLHHMLTENDRANSLPPEITDDMYEDLGVTFLEEGENISFHSGYRGEYSLKDDSSAALSEGSGGKLHKRGMTLKEYNDMIIPLASQI